MYLETFGKFFMWSVNTLWIRIYENSYIFALFYYVKHIYNKIQNLFFRVCFKQISVLVTQTSAVI